MNYELQNGDDECTRGYAEVILYLNSLISAEQKFSPEEKLMLILTLILLLILIIIIIIIIIIINYAKA